MIGSLLVLAFAAAPVVPDELVPLVRAVVPSFDPKTNPGVVQHFRVYEGDGLRVLHLSTPEGQTSLSLFKAGHAEVVARLDSFCLSAGSFVGIDPSEPPRVKGGQVTFRDDQDRPLVVKVRPDSLLIGPDVAPELIPQIRAVFPAYDPRTNRLDRTLYLQSVAPFEVDGAKLLSISGGSCADTDQATLVSLAPKGPGFQVSSSFDGPLHDPDQTVPLGPGLTGLVFDTRDDGQVLVFSRKGQLSLGIRGSHHYEGDTYNSIDQQSVLTILNSRANGLLEVRETFKTRTSGRGGPARSPALYRFDGSKYLPEEALRNPLVESAKASSTLIEKGSRKDAYVPLRAWDGVPETAWVEGVKGPGLGESLTLTLKRPTRLGSVSLRAGCGATSALWKKNHRLKVIKVSLDDGAPITLTLEDVETPQSLALPLTGEVRTLRFEIAEVYPGSAYDDACISEVELKL